MFELMSLGMIIFSGIVGILVLGLIIVLLYALFKYLKMINHPKPVLAFIPLLGMCILGDTVLTDNKGDVYMTKKFSMPKTLFMYLPVISLLVGLIPFIGGLLSSTLMLLFSFILNVDMLKRLKNTQNFNEVRLLAIINLFVGIIPQVMILFRGSHADEIFPKYSGRFNGGVTGDVNAFFNRYLGSNSNSNKQDYNNFNQYGNDAWGNQNQTGWGQQSNQSQWGSQNQTGWGQQNNPSQWGQQNNSWDNQSRWGGSQQNTGWGQQSNQSRWDNRGNQKQTGWGQQNNQSQWDSQSQTGWGQQSNQSQWGSQSNSWDNQWSSQSPIAPQDSNWGDNMSDELDYASEFASGDTDINNRGWQ